MKAGGAPTSTAEGRGHLVHPLVYVSPGEALELCGFLFQSLFCTPANFHTFGVLPGRVVVSQVSGTVYDAYKDINHC